MSARVFAALLLAGATLAAAQAPPPQPPPATAPVPPAAEAAPAAPIVPDDQLIRVVALFRHGVRAPLSDLSDTRPRHAQNDWPSLADWGVQEWGDLTPRGATLARALGRDYAGSYRTTWPTGFTAYLWADNESRTRATATGLMSGLVDGGVRATLNSLAEGVDPLFHPFTARCGTPKPEPLRAITAIINGRSQSWIDSTYAAPLRRLYGVLACPGRSSQCIPLASVTDNAASFCTQPSCGPSPIVWKGQFPYANTASETFLLEYANGMDPRQIGWGRMWQPPPNDTNELLMMLPLHEFYFDQTQRDSYVAQIEASNLVREIRQALNDERVGCRRLPSGYQFAALVGHDTNIAGVASLLQLSWSFITAPDGTRGVPDNDPLPAGALVFELRQRASGQFVRVSYAAQGLREMRTCIPPACPAFRVPVRCDGYSVTAGSCDIPLNVFNSLARGAVAREFLSGCEDGQQDCPTRQPQE
jgi:4-phytase/acid phosphatase